MDLQTKLTVEHDVHSGPRKKKELFFSVAPNYPSHGKKQEKGQTQQERWKESKADILGR